MSTTLDDIRYDLEQEGWYSEVEGLWVEEKDRYIKYLGHKLIFKKYRWNGEMVPEKLGKAYVEGTSSQFAGLVPLAQEMLRHISGPSIPQVKLFPPHLEEMQFPEKFNEKSTVEEIIEGMMGLGWNYSDSIASRHRSEKQTYRHFSFNRWDWHDRFVGGPTTFPVLASVNANWNLIIYNLSQKVLKAWEDFPNSIPYENAAGIIAEDKFKTKISFLR